MVTDGVRDLLRGHLFVVVIRSLSRCLSVIHIVIYIPSWWFELTYAHVHVRAVKPLQHSDALPRSWPQHDRDIATVTVALHPRTSDAMPRSLRRAFFDDGFRPLHACPWHFDSVTSTRAGVRHVRDVRRNRAADFRGPPAPMSSFIKNDECNASVAYVRS